MILGMITGVIIFTFGILIGAALYKICYSFSFGRTAELLQSSSCYSIQLEY